MQANEQIHSSFEAFQIVIALACVKDNGSLILNAPRSQRIAVAPLLVKRLVAFGAFAPSLFKTSTKVKHLTHTVAREIHQVTITENSAVESSNNKEIKCLVKDGSTVLWVKARNPSAAIGGSLNSRDHNFDAYIPLETFRQRVGDQIMTRVGTGFNFKGEIVELSQITLKVNEIDQVDETVAK